MDPACVRPAIRETGAGLRGGGLRPAGFTLIELLLAVSLGAILLSAVYTAYSGTLRSSQRAQEAAAEIQSWRYFAERLRADLVRLRLSRGDDTAQGQPDTLTFGMQPSAEGRAGARVQYRWQRSGRGGLVHRSLLQEGEESVGVVYEGVDEFAFRYLTPDGWRDRFSGVEDWPRAVECTLRVAGKQRRIAVAVEIEPVPVEK